MNRIRRAVCLTLVAIAASVPPNAIAEEAAPFKVPKRYSWDRRPLKCFSPDASPNTPMCAEPKWTDWSGAVGNLQSLFTEPDFELVARAERELGFSDQRFSSNDPTRLSGQYHFDAWYWALYAMFSQQPERYAQTLEKWKAASGGQGYVVLAEAMLLSGEGWAARGTGFAGTVSPEAWKIYQRKLKDAEAVLDSASPAVKKMGAWHAFKLSLAYQLGAEKGAGAPEFQKSVAAWPYYKRLYSTAINYSMPEWGGDFDAVEAVVRHAYEKTKATAGAAWYAGLYTETFAANARHVLPATNVDWPLMKKGFNDALKIEEFGDGLLFSFARTACQMRDRDEARRLYALIDALPEAKRPKVAADPCREFAKGTAPGGATLERGAGNTAS